MSTLKFTRKHINLLLDVLSLASVISLLLITYISWTKLPDIIPTHYDFYGNINDYGSKDTIILIPCITLFSFVLIFILSKYPESYNYPVCITPKNKEIQYNIASTFMRVINFETVILFLIIQIDIIKVSAKTYVPMLFMLIIGISCIIYFKKSRKYK